MGGAVGLHGLVTTHTDLTSLAEVVVPKLRAVGTARVALALHAAERKLIDLVQADILNSDNLECKVVQSGRVLCPKNERSVMKAFFHDSSLRIDF